MPVPTTWPPRWRSTGRNGTTRTLVSLVTAPIERMCEQLRWIAALAEAGAADVLGAHLEGPFLSHARCGAQHPDHLLAPDPQALAELLKAGQGHVRSVTVAPELPGGLDLIERLVDEGVVAAVGHTDGTYADATNGFARGATLLTHAFNGMRPLHHREPGPGRGRARRRGDAGGHQRRGAPAPRARCGWSRTGGWRSSPTPSTRPARATAGTFSAART